VNRKRAVFVEAIPLNDERRNAKACPAVHPTNPPLRSPDGHEPQPASPLSKKVIQPFRWGEVWQSSSLPGETLFSAPLIAREALENMSRNVFVPPINTGIDHPHTMAIRGKNDITNLDGSFRPHRIQKHRHHEDCQNRRSNRNKRGAGRRRRFVFR